MERGCPPDRTRDQILSLILLVALRDRGAFVALCAVSSAKLFRTCLGVLNDRTGAEEAVQKLFAKVWLGADRFAATA